MKKVIMAVALAAGAGATMAEPMVRPGLWEIRVVRQTLNGQDVTALMPVAVQMLGNLSPQQRQQAEATFGKPVANVNTTQRICVSPEMAAGDKPLMPANVKCEPTTLNRAGDRATFEFNCKDQGRTMVGKGVSTLASESVATRIDMVMNDARGRYVMQNDSQARFIDTNCGGLKPADQVVREAQAAQKK